MCPDTLRLSEERNFVSLSEFIRVDLDAIVSEFADFAKSHLESATRLSKEELQDTAAELLLNVAQDMESHQSEAGRSDKSRGDLPENSPALIDDAKGHAQDRFASSFSLLEMISEYRALRANILRRWRAADVADPSTAVEETIRFGEAVDQALTESIAWYTSRTDRARELMVGMIAHDLRNPLGAIMMSAQYLLRSDAVSGSEMKAVGRILSSASAMEKMVGDLLDFAQVRMGGRVSIKPESVSLRDVCEDAVGELRAFHPDRLIELDVGDTLDGKWDRDRLRQIISNLTSNALSHGAADAPVLVNAFRAGITVQLSVHNVGEPIPWEKQSDIFDPLKRLPTASKHDRASARGIGLGLFIVKELARAHGGSISLTSSRDAGTTFTVTLPVTAPINRE